MTKLFLPLLTWLDTLRHPIAVTAAVHELRADVDRLEAERDEARRQRDIAQNALTECESENKQLRAAQGAHALRWRGVS